MELTYKELKKREVVNIADGSSLGRINDLEISFPKGKMTAIFVPGKNAGGLLSLIFRSKMRIDEANIIKIGGDVILVNLKCGETCDSIVTLNPPRKAPPSCPSACPPPCPPICNPCAPSQPSPIYVDADRIDLGDY